MTGELVELRGSYTAEEEKAVLRKINTVILPLVSGSRPSFQPYTS